MAAARSELMQFKVTPEERRVIENRAGKEKVSVSDYVRGCVLMEMILDGDFEALKIVAREVGRKTLMGMRKKADRLASLAEETEEISGRKGVKER